jgi:hypothetical protein
MRLPCFLRDSMLNIINDIIYCAFMVWLICLLFAFLESLWEERKNKNTLAEILVKFDLHDFARKHPINMLAPRHTPRGIHGNY